MYTVANSIFPPSVVRELDRRAIQDHGIPGYTLMSRAGQVAFDAARTRWPGARRWLVVCGAGNNAGDGYVIARRAREAGFDVEVVAVSDPAKLAGDAGRAWADFRAGGGVAKALTDADAMAAQVVVDALLGTGLDRDVDGTYRDAVELMNAAAAPVLAVDIPSGLHGTSGEVMGAAVQAALTATFVARKLGLYLGAGPELCGDIVFSDLGVPPDVAAGIDPSLRLVDEQLLARLLPRRPASAHKGLFGHVLIVGGNHGMGGAVRLAGEAALRAGAGLVSVATRAATAPAIVAGRPELMCRAVDNLDELDGLLERATHVAIGPGLGQDAWAKQLFTRVMAAELPTVVDADALNLLAEQEQRRDDWVLTPHPGEAARLLHRNSTAVQGDRLGALGQLQARYGGISVLKGHATLVGKAASIPYLIDRGNPGMATAGMGDVLTGAIAGLWAQLPEHAIEATAIAAWAHATAGDRAAANGERGLVAGDLLQELRACLNP
jgi:NAD(P)H-hydrate epimerase